jgi:putative lipase involved disintegration of autophagic bodies
MDRKDINTNVSGWHWDMLGASEADKAEPPVVLNNRASLHTRIAWCWGQVCDAYQLSMIDKEHCDPEVILQSIQSFLTGVPEVLAHLASLTLTPRHEGVQYD